MGEEYQGAGGGGSETEKAPPVYFEDSHHIVYKKDSSGVFTRLGRRVPVQTEDGPKIQVIPMDRGREPATKKDRMKARQHLPYRTKAGHVVNPSLTEYKDIQGGQNGEETS